MSRYAAYISGNSFVSEARRLAREIEGTVSVVSTWHNIMAKDATIDDTIERRNLIKKSSVFILLTNTNGERKSERHVELGIAIASGCTIFVIGETENLYQKWPTVFRFNSVSAFVTYLKDMLKDT